MTDLAGLRDRFGLDPRAVEQLREFARQRGVPETRIVQVGLQDRYVGPEKTAAMQAYATLFDAAHHRKLSPARAAQYRAHVLPAFEQGRVGVRLRDSALYIAAYNGRNEGNSLRYEANTLYLPGDGLDLSDDSTRGVLVHEAEHILQDATRQARSVLESERRGHAAFADYMLRDSGALVPIGETVDPLDIEDGRSARGDILRLDHDAFQKMQRTVHGAPDRKLVFEIFAGAAQANAEAGRLELNGPYAELGTWVGAFIASDSGYPEPFGDVYARTLQVNTVRFANSSIEEIKRALSVSAPADGL